MPSSRTQSPQPPALDLTDPEAVAAEFARLKRRAVAADNALAEVTNNRRKKTLTVENEGRGIRKTISLFESLSSIVDEADRRMIEEESNESVDEPLTLEEKELKLARDRTFTAYNLLLRLVPRIKDIIIDPDSNVLNTFLADLQEGANGARGEDISRIKVELANWINLDYNPVDLLNPKNRDNRGLQNDVCGELLTPIKFDWQDLEVRANIRNSKEGFTLGNKYFITCLYPKGRANPDQLEHCFLRGRFLLQVYCSIFTSPSSAEGFDEENEDGPARKKQRTTAQNRATKANVATILNMDGKVTGRSIAYAAVLLIFNLTDAKQWTSTHNGFNFIAFYNFIVDYFEVFPDAEAKLNAENLLAWWNLQVFPHHVVAATDSRESRDELEAQRARSRAARRT